ncbi:hypothetical protein [Carnobacterium pleistocenium]|uniref:hypothetical protein n=1 Tax=Carnobacterium pleistocenium TaxID=181073 RepID=UPI000554B390|nr:hypothetical protein [Carnobacterium pleistocenium]
MKKRLKKKLSNNNKYELNELEELIFLAHRINQTETGCVFIYDSPHVNQLKLEIRSSKINFQEESNAFSIYYDEFKSGWASDEMKEFKKTLIKLLEELGAKKD